MTKKWTHTAAYEFFGTKPRNIQWSWSARNEDTKTVVVTLWQDEYDRQKGGLVYARSGYAPEDRPKSPGFNELMDNLAWARDNCEGRLKVISAIARDTKANPRSIQECFPTKTVMRITHLDTADGSFSLVAEGL